MILMKVSDISNEARPMDVAMPWLDCLLQEFFNQVLMIIHVFVWFSATNRARETVPVFDNRILCDYVKQIGDIAKFYRGWFYLSLLKSFRIF